MNSQKAKLGTNGSGSALPIVILMMRKTASVGILDLIRAKASTAAEMRTKLARLRTANPHEQLASRLEIERAPRGGP